jgi:hypothetical protein
MLTTVGPFFQIHTSIHTRFENKIVDCQVSVYIRAKDFLQWLTRWTRSDSKVVGGGESFQYPASTRFILLA